MNQINDILKKAYSICPRKKKVEPPNPIRNLDWQLELVVDNVIRGAPLELSEMRSFLLRAALQPLRSSVRGPNDLLVVLSREPDEENDGEINPLIYAVRMRREDIYDENDYDYTVSYHAFLRRVFYSATKAEEIRRIANAEQSQ